MSIPGARPLHGGLAQPSSCVARRVDRARDPHRITVAVPIPSFLFFAKFDQKLNWSQIFTKMKVVQNFTSYKTYFGAQS